MLNEFIRNPREYAPGTKMAYGGMKRDEQRADLLVYLRTLSEDPEPLPQPPAEDAAAEEPAAAEETSAAEEPAAGEETAAAQEPAAAEETAAAQETAAEGEAGEVQTQGIAALVAGVDPEQGQAAARVCQACHTFEEDGAHRVGPNLWGIVGRQIAHGEGYAYSDALQARSGETWTLEALNEFIHNPREFAPGTKMGYGGMRRDDQRIELLAYLHSLSDDPEPLPQQGQAPEDGAEAPGTDGETAEQQAAQEAPAGEEPAQPEPAEETAAEGEGQDIAELVAGMDPEGKQGQAAVRVCRTCHTFEEGGAHRVGPNLWNVVGRPIASAEGYSYSDALQGMSGQTWTLETLNEFLLNPRGFAPGTKMAFGGLKRDEQRLQLLAYLRSLGADQ
jgi:cytochrome c